MKIKPELCHVTLDGTTAWGCDTPEKLTNRMKEVEFKEGAAILKGNPGDCELCGSWSGRLVNGVCSPCRDRYQLS